MKRMRSLALCVYFATYFRLDHNRDSSDLFQQANPVERELIHDFWSVKKQDIDREIVDFETLYEEDVFDSFSHYKEVC